MNIRVVTLTEDETVTLVFKATVTDQQIISYVWLCYLEGTMDEPPADEFPKTVEQFNALGSFEMSIAEQELLE